MSKLKNPRLFLATLGAAASALPVAAFAQSASTTQFDPAPFVTKIEGTIPGLLLVGGAVFAVILAIKSVQWAIRAMSGG